MLLSVIFSFRNEQEVLPELIRRCRNVFESEQVKKIFSDYELIFVNDDSTDQSLEILITEAKKKKNIKIITMSRCFGISPCVLAGIEHASGDAIVYMDADLQDPPEIIPELINIWKSDPNIEVVHTVRQSRRGETAIKKITTKCGYWILNRVTPFRLRPETGDFKLLSKKAAQHLIQMKEKKPFLRGLIYWIGFKQAYCPYHRDARWKGKTKFPVFSPRVIGNFFESALVSFSSLPLQLASLLGLMTIAVSFLLSIYVIFEKLSGKAIPGWAAIMIAVIFLGSIQLLCLGILGMYISSIYEECKRRPNYIIAHTAGFQNHNLKQ